MGCYAPAPVCRSRTWGVTREHSPRKTEIGTEVAHFTRDLDTTFKVNRSKVNLNSQHARTGATWRINTKTLSTCRGEAYRVATRTACNIWSDAARRAYYTHTGGTALSKWMLTVASSNAMRGSLTAYRIKLNI